MRTLLLILTCLLSSNAFAVRARNPIQPLAQFSCEEVLTSGAQKEAGAIEFHTSGRDENLERQLRADAKIITDIAHDLGLATPPHKFYFVPDEQLNVMAAMGGQPLPTWMDGHKLATSMGSVMGVLEFVTPGCPTCRSYYSDKTTLVHQRAVLMHVMGHNDMANTARVILDRQIDPPADGMTLANLIADAYEKHDHDEVALFAQHLNSIQYMQDFTYGAVEMPEKFAPTTRQKSSEKTQWGSTANTLQALTQQFDPNTPEWKKDILKYFERVNRVYPAYANSKIMNEGWATMQQYLIARHAPWTTSKDVIEYASLMGGVAFPSLSNPYWVGLMGWWNMYQQFLRHNDIQKLSEKEKDRAFIAWARQTYAKMTDYEWLQMTIDQEFCDKWRLFMFRKTQQQEMKQGVPPDKQEFIALTRSADRVQKYLIRKLVDRSFMVPRIVFENPALHDSSTLNFRQELQHNLPIEPISAIKTLFVQTQIFNKRAHLSGYISSKWAPAKDLDLKKLILDYYQKNSPHIPQEHILDYVKNLSPEELEKVAMQSGALQQSFQPTLVEFEVSPNGHVEVYIEEQGRRQPIEQLQTIGKMAIEHYQEDMLASLHDGLAENIRKKWAEPSMMVADHTTDSSMEIVQYAPHAGHALQELIQMIEVRFPKMFKKAVNSGAVTPSARGVKIRVLPEIPQFGYDQQYQALMQKSKPVGRVDQSDGSHKPNWEEDDNGSQLSAGEYLPGDLFGKPKQQGKGKGDGDSSDEESDQQGDPSDNNGDEPQPGNGGSQDGSDIEIPLSLYGKLLADELELPNLRRTEGQSQETRRVSHGTVHKPNGQLVWQEIAKRAHELAMAMRKAKGDTSKVSAYELIKEGMKVIDPSDYIVRDKTERPKPDFDAVLIVNIDLTGSMTGERMQMAKNLVFNLKALLSAVYKNVKIHYVAFDSAAEEVPESRIWTYWKGGGTAYAPALQLDQKIFEQYPNSRWNKYVLTIGDGETADGEQFVQELNKMSKDLQYAGLAITTNGDWGGYQDLVQHVEGFKGTWPWIGTTILKSPNQIMNAIKELFPKGPAK